MRRRGRPAGAAAAGSAGAAGGWMGHEPVSSLCLGPAISLWKDGLPATCPHRRAGRQILIRRHSRGAAWPGIPAGRPGGKDIGDDHAASLSPGFSRSYQAGHQTAKVWQSSSRIGSSAEVDIKVPCVVRSGRKPGGTVAVIVPKVSDEG